jgi:hypothetical protein
MTVCAVHDRLRGKADTTLCESPLLQSLLGVKRTLLFAAHMSANDPKRTWGTSVGLVNRYDGPSNLGPTWNAANLLLVFAQR